MLEAQRRKLAYIVARDSGIQATSIYAHASREHSQMSGSGGDYFDYRRGERFSDREDHATGAKWTVAVEGGQFTGYEFVRQQHFAGTIDTAGLVRLYDYADEAWYDYSAQRD